MFGAFRCSGPDHNYGSRHKQTIANTNGTQPGHDDVTKMVRKSNASLPPLPHAQLAAVFVQVEADIAPFRALLLGMFFMTVGFEIDLVLCFNNLPLVASLVSPSLFFSSCLVFCVVVCVGPACFLRFCEPAMSMCL